MGWWGNPGPLLMITSEKLRGGRVEEGPSLVFEAPCPRSQGREVAAVGISAAGPGWGSAPTGAQAQEIPSGSVLSAERPQGVGRGLPSLPGHMAVPREDSQGRSGVSAG